MFKFSRSVLAVLAVTTGLSGCASLSQKPQWQQAKATAANGWNEIRDSFGRLVKVPQPLTVNDYVQACVTRSRLVDPQLAGQVIESPRYALITLQQRESMRPMNGGELCIINKVTQVVDLTAIDNLRFLPQPVMTPMAQNRR